MNSLQKIKKVNNIYNKTLFDFVFDNCNLKKKIFSYLFNSTKCFQCKEIKYIYKKTLCYYCHKSNIYQKN